MNLLLRNASLLGGVRPVSDRPVAAEPVA